MFIGKCIISFLIDEKLCIITDKKIVATDRLVKPARCDYFKENLYLQMDQSS